jgi:predicted naringenin-chalcone synthase
MTAYITRPAIHLADHQVATAQILDDIRAHHPDHPRLPAIVRAVQACGVDTRYWTRPFGEVTSPGGVADRARTAFTDAATMAEDAARRALTDAGLQPGDIDAVVTSHTTSWAVPQLDIHLINALGLRPDVTRIPLATLACAGGVHGLVRAVHHLRANPGHTVLVVAAEVLSTIYHHADTELQHMVYKALFGDAAAATVVTDRLLGPGLAIDGTLPLTRSTWEFLLPDSEDRYWGRIDGAGLHFDSTRAAVRAAADTLPHLAKWLDGRQPTWAVVHPGGPGIIRDTVTGLGLDQAHGDQSRKSLAEVGNLGGVACMDVLARTHVAPPRPGAEGAVVAFGPGFTAAGLYGTWHT